MARPSSVMASMRASAIGLSSRCPSAASIRRRRADPTLHVVNLPVSAVNWAATEKYAESARYSHYMANSAESDYAALAGEVAAVAEQDRPEQGCRRRVSTLAVDARKRLASWPKDHYGYRADDVREMLGMLDEAISDLRVAAGETSFAIDLVATTPRAATEPRADAEGTDSGRSDRPGHRRCQGLGRGGRSCFDSSHRHCRHRQPAECRCPQPGRGRLADWAIHTIGEEVARRKGLRRAERDDAEARIELPPGAPTCAPCRACWKPSSARTSSLAASGPTKSTR